MIDTAATPQIGLGQVRHVRLRPARNSFTYATYFLMLPMRGLRAQPSKALARNRFGLISFHDRDHGDGRADSLAWLDELLASEGVGDADGEVWLHCYPRVLGVTFKPVSFWYCHRADATLAAIVVEVNNTFGERHCYLLRGVGKMIDSGDGDPHEMLRSRDLFGFWQGLLRVVGSFGDCPRCLAVCPVGNDYHAHLADAQKVIPEKTPEKVALGQAMQGARAQHEQRWRSRCRPQRLEHALGRAETATRAWSRGSCRSSSKRSASARPRHSPRPTRTRETWMVGVFKQPLTAADIKAKARALGADLVGIADGAAMNAHPPDPPIRGARPISPSSTASG